MLISLIAAVADNGVIGKANQLPWHLPADLRHFKRLTLGKPVLMGRRTYQSIGRPLPDRINIVLTHDSGFEAAGCVVVHSLEAGLRAAAGHAELMVMGGAALYAHLLPRADRLYLTLVHATVDGDVRFPEFDMSEWRELERQDHAPDEGNRYPYSFVTLERLTAPV